MKSTRIKERVKSRYAEVARSSCTTANFHGGFYPGTQEIGRKAGYSDRELNSVPEEANLGLGCGNPVAQALLKEGDVVADLGAGAGFDAFLAAAKVGKSGRVIGVDMTPAMVRRARENALKGGFENVEFRLGQIEHMPVCDRGVDVIISNCVINLCPEKEKAFKEAFRVLRPGGRLIVSDIVLLKELPEAIRRSVEAYVGCIAGAVMKEEYLAAINEAGFRDLRLADEKIYPLRYPDAGLFCSNMGGVSPHSKRLITSVASITTLASKPR